MRDFGLAIFITLYFALLFAIGAAIVIVDYLILTAP